MFAWTRLVPLAAAALLVAHRVGEPFGTLMLALSLLVGAIGLGAGRTNMMQGGVQVVIFAAFLFLALVP